MLLIEVMRTKWHCLTKLTSIKLISSNNCQTHKEWSFETEIRKLCEYILTVKVITTEPWILSYNSAPRWRKFLMVCLVPFTFPFWVVMNYQSLLTNSKSIFLMSEQKHVELSMVRLVTLTVKADSQNLNRLLFQNF